ncbi:nucleic acid binding protein [Novymonas esmeraldas]|uniref:Nucleic acid binding protein n=1 Tax=Novymonas esmeraldas TaxID=1808958 RepID=A0AAW0F534_9TRYP
MVASITFRLKSSNHVGTIDMEGSVMSCRDAQQAIAVKLCAPPEEINVFLAGSSALLHPDEDLPAYAVVDVVRQTYSGRPLFLSRSRFAAPSSAAESVPSSSGFGATFGSGDGQPLTEEERLAQLQAEAALDTGIDEVSTRFRRGGGRGAMGIGMGGRGAGRGMAAGAGGDFFGAGRGRGDAFRANMEENFRPPPKGYICHNCGKGGHLIQHCPSAKGGKAMKVLSFPVGIPESMLVECTMDDPAPKFITRDHRLVKRRVDPSVFTAISIAGHGTSEQDDLHDDLQELVVGADDSADTAGCGTCTTTGTTAADASPATLTTTAKAGLDSSLQCAVHGGVAREAMRLPCCGRLICHDCFNKMAEEALDETRSIGDEEDGGVLCPGCEEPLIMDEVVPATDEREKIKLLLLERKREREA